METQVNVGESKNLNFDGIQRLASSSRFAVDVFHDLAARKKHLYRSINVGSYSEKLGIPFEQALEIFKGLEVQGAGSVVIGRDNTCPTSFVPQYNLRAIGVAGMGGAKAFEQAESEPADPETEDDVTPAEPKAKLGRPKGSKNKQRRLQASPNKKFDRAKFMRKMWAEGRIHGRKKVRGRRTAKPNADKVIKQITSLLKQLAA